MPVIERVNGFLRRLFSRPPQPPEAAEAVERALAAFSAAYPDDDVKGAGVPAVEDNRIIVEVHYGIGRPGPRRYFGVSRETLEVLGELLASEWWPRGLK